MNFKSIGFKAVIATAIVASSAVAIAPAQAGDIRNKKLSFLGTSVLQKNNGAIGTTSILNFAEKFVGDTSGIKNYSTKNGTGTLALNNDPVFGIGDFIFKDLNLTKTSATTWSLLGAVGGPNGTVTNFISGLSSGVTYSLNSFGLTKLSDGSFKAVLDGIFSGNIGDVDGSITFQSGLTKVDNSVDLSKPKKKGSKLFLANTSGSSFSGDTTAIPTPALIPGLLGLGVAALRKRKSEESEVEAAETAKA